VSGKALAGEASDTCIPAVVEAENANPRSLWSRYQPPQLVDARHPLGVLGLVDPVLQFPP